jgi:hypothetical protein
MIDKVISDIRDPPLGSSNVAVNVCAESIPTNNVTETGDADCIVAGPELLIFEHPSIVRIRQSVIAKRMLELLIKAELSLRVISSIEYMRKEYLADKRWMQ